MPKIQSSISACHSKIMQNHAKSNKINQALRSCKPRVCQLSSEVLASTMKMVSACGHSSPCCSMTSRKQLETPSIGRNGYDRRNQTVQSWLVSMLAPDLSAPKSCVIWGMHGNIRFRLDTNQCLSTTPLREATYKNMQEQFASWGTILLFTTDHGSFCLSPLECLRITVLSVIYYVNSSWLLNVLIARELAGASKWG